ncbi:MAG: DUF3017 domain-containing protein [Candidatus Nanopelagicales bacterium]|jgi:hypothetical protein
MAEVHRLPTRRRRWWSQWPITVVLVGVVAALAIVALDHFRIGSLVLAASLVLAFVLRLVLPQDRVGMLAVRSRRVDLVVLGSLAAALVVFALWVPPPA